MIADTDEQNPPTHRKLIATIGGQLARYGRGRLPRLMTAATRRNDPTERGVGPRRGEPAVALAGTGVDRPFEMPARPRPVFDARSSARGNVIVGGPSPANPLRCRHSSLSLLACTRRTG